MKNNPDESFSSSLIRAATKSIVVVTDTLGLRVRRTPCNHEGISDICQVKDRVADW